ncbi:MAG: hypothetical protein HGA96_13395 [Desulfobulbaceae bacterium]|nr:hypothetical protein [Desulfobulbaceae bacterium]
MAALGIRGSVTAPTVAGGQALRELWLVTTFRRADRELDEGARMSEITV